MKKVSVLQLMRVVKFLESKGTDTVILSRVVICLLVNEPLSWKLKNQLTNIHDFGWRYTSVWWREDILFTKSFPDAYDRYRVEKMDESKFLPQTEEEAQLYAHEQTFLNDMKVATR